MSNPNLSANDPARTEQARTKHSRHTRPVKAANGFSYTPRWIEIYYAQGKLNKSQYLLLETIATEIFSWKRPVVVMSISQMADSASLSVSNTWAWQAKRDLVERGLLRQIEVDTGGNRGGYAYTLSAVAPDTDVHEDLKCAEELRCDSWDEMEKKARSRLARLNELPGTEDDADSEQASGPTAPAHEQHEISDEQGTSPPEEFQEMVSAMADGMEADAEGSNDQEAEEVEEATATTEQPEQPDRSEQTGREPEESRLGMAFLRRHLESQEGVTRVWEDSTEPGSLLAWGEKRLVPFAWSEIDWTQKRIEIEKRCNANELEESSEPGNEPASAPF